MSKHTPGPWFYNPDGFNLIGEVDSYAIGRVDTPDTEPIVARAIGEPNARLIAAAPELLEACYTMLNLETAATWGAECPALEGLDVPYHFDKLRAAIRKATGE